MCLACIIKGVYEACKRRVMAFKRRARGVQEAVRLWPVVSSY
jgi:hypothetical protein